ncbi:MAG: DNA-binding response regulator [Firmicutes bacterium HGW-Firmicutes-15]|nr:MAG: DNA-binding response regulator [Firmicutes bacterium HGW-Firmicutes-15]
MHTIYVIDDEENIRLLISQYLQKEGFAVESFGSIEELNCRLESGYPDMFILDIMLPGQDGLDFCRQIRQHSGVPVIFISARRQALDRIMGLEIGGDDYLSKPFSPRELIARVRSVLRRTLTPPNPDNYLQAGNLKVLPDDRLILVDGQEFSMTTREFELLLLLVQHPQRTFNRQELLDRVWGYDYEGSERAVDDLIKRLRKKLKESGSEANIQTIWGYGYRLDGQVQKHFN